MNDEVSKQLLDELRWLRGLAVALAKGDPELADELVQDGALALLQQQQPVRSIRGWLATVARRRVNSLRQTKRQRLNTEPVDIEPATTDDVANIAARLEAQQQLNAAVLALPTTYQEVIVAHHLDGIALADLARRRRVAPATVRQQHKRALDMLRTHLDQRGNSRGAQGWRAAVAPLLAVPSGLETAGLAAGASTSVAAGTLIMKKLIAAAAVVLCAWWGWTLAFAEPAPPGSGDALDTPLAAAAAAPDDVSTPGANANGTGLAREKVAALPVAPGRRLRLTVHGGDGTALNGAIVHCGPSGQRSRFGVTDRNGQLLVDGWGAAGEVWVWARNRAPFRQSLDRLRGAHTITLPDQPVVSGLVTIDNAPPTAPIALSARWVDSAKPPPLPHGWSGHGSNIVRFEQALVDGGPWNGWLSPADYWRAAVFTEPNGSFVLRGATQDQLKDMRIGTGGFISFSPFRLVTDDGPVRPRYEVPAPPTAIHIKLLRTPTLRMRLVFPDGDPVALGRLTVRAVQPDGSISSNSGGHSDRDGRIERALFPSEIGGPEGWWRAGQQFALDSVELSVRHDDAVATPLRWDRAAIAERISNRVLDLGTVEVPRRHHVILQIVDPNDAPVAGLCVLLQDELSAPSNEDGRIRAQLAQRDVRGLWVGGPGWGAQEARVIGGRGSSEAPFRLRLQHRANRLVLQVPDDLAIEQFDKLRIGIDCASSIFPPVRRPNQQRAWGPTDLHQLAGGSDMMNWNSAQPDVPAQVSIPLPASRELVLVGVRPGLPITAWLEDASGQRIFERSGRTPDLGKQARLQLEGAAATSLVRVRVRLDEQPAKDAVVTCRIDGERYASPRLDEQGQGLMRLHASGAVVELIVAAPGAVAQQLPLQLTAGDHNIDVVLQRASPLRVAVQDASGVPVAAIVHLDLLKSPSWHVRELLGAEVAAVRHELANAPPGPVAVLAHFGGQTFRRVLQRPDGNSEAALIVPRPVPIALHLPSGTVGQQIELRWSPEGGIASEANANVFTFSWTGWRPSSVELLPGRYHYTLHRGSHEEVAGQGIVEITQATTELRLNVTIPAEDR